MLAYKLSGLNSNRADWRGLGFYRAEGTLSDRGGLVEVIGRFPGGNADSGLEGSPVVRLWGVSASRTLGGGECSFVDMCGNIWW